MAMNVEGFLNSSIVEGFSRSLISKWVICDICSDGIISSLYLQRSRNSRDENNLHIYFYFAKVHSEKKKPKNKFLATAVARKERNDMFSCPDMTACCNLHSSV